MVSCSSEMRLCSSAYSLLTVSTVSTWLQQKPNFIGPGTKLQLWQRSCDRVLTSLEKFSQKLLDNIKGFHEHGDTSGVDVTGSSCITCLAHLAVLYEAFCRTDPVAMETYNRCDSALQRLGTLTYELELDEYTYFDLLLGVRSSFLCFSRMTAQVRGWDRTHGRNRSRSLMPA